MFRKRSNPFERTHSEPLQEDSVITPRAQRRNTNVIDNIYLRAQRNNVVMLAEEVTTVRSSIPKCALGIDRVGYVFSRLTDKMRQQRRTSSAEFRARHRGVEVNIGNGVFLNPFRKIFSPLGATNEAVL